MSDTFQRYPSHLPYPFSKAIRVGDFLYLSGQVPMTPLGEVVLGDIREQTEAAMARIGETLAECGASFEQVIRPPCGCRTCSISRVSTTCISATSTVASRCAPRSAAPNWPWASMSRSKSRHGSAPVDPPLPFARAMPR